MVKGKFIYCAYCKKKVFKYNWELTRSKNIYCTKKCSDKAKIRKDIRYCKECNKKFVVKPSEKKKCCSFKCSAKNREANGRSEEHLIKLNKILIENRKKIERCKICGRLKSKNKLHTCPSKAELSAIMKGKMTPKLRKKMGIAQKKAYKEGKKIPYWLGKKRTKETIDKAVKTRLERIKNGEIVSYWKGKKRSKKDRKKMSKSHIGLQVGEKNSRWRGGVSSKKKLIWGSYKYQKWRKSVFKRDDYTCQICGKKGIELNAHHIDTVYNNPKLIFNKKNGKTLCKKCHIELHKKIGWGKIKNENKK